MRKIIIITIFLAAGIIITSCKSEHTTKQSTLIEKSWTHSFEESKPGEFDVYIPSNSKEFPISRYRQVFNFKENNLCEYLVLEANDAHNMKDGNWELDEKANTIKIFNDDSEALYEFEIIELKDDLLKLKAINS